MPSKSSKSSRKEQQNFIRGDHVTVRDCLAWDKGKKKSVKSSRQDDELADYDRVFLPRKGDVGRPLNRGYNMDDDTPRHAKPVKDEGSVIEALRGWPGSRRENDFWADDYSPPAENDEAIVFAKSKKAAKGKNKGKATSLESEGVPDPYIGDLMSHHYLHASVKAREAEAMRKEKMESQARSRPSTSSHKGIKANKTSQLRSVANAEKVEHSAHELWKMPRFEKGAQPHLTTFQQRQRDRAECTRKACLVDPISTYPDEPGQASGLGYSDPVVDVDADMFDKKVHDDKELFEA